MKDLQWDNVDKSSWPAGAWQDEPDKKQWTDKATGLPCLIVRNAIGALCGYVGVGKAHPFHGDSYHDHYELPAHGGLTFAAACSAGPDPSVHVCHLTETGDEEPVWWFGFDCGHLGDLMPKYDREYWGLNEGASYKTISYVEGHVAALAEALAAKAA